MTWGTDRLDELKSGEAVPPPVVETLRLGLLDDWEPGRAQKRWEPSPEILQADGSLFGGYMAALADQIMVFAALSVIPGDRAFRTINLGVQFLKLVKNAPLHIEGRVVAQSRKIITTEAVFRLEDGTLVAKASAQQATISFPGK